MLEEQDEELKSQYDYKVEVTLNSDFRNEPNVRQLQVVT